jgi:hypothetical protein
LLYGKLAQLHADLTSHKQADAICKQVQHEFQEPDTGAAREALQFAESETRRQKLLELVRAFPLRLAASLLILGVGLGCGVGIMAASLRFLPMPPKFLPLPWNWQVNSDVVAKLEAVHDVVWQTASENPDTLPTRGLRVGQQVRISQGLMQLNYRNGVGIILEGPAIFEVRSEHGGKLFSGKLSVTTPSDAEPFHIETLAGRLQVGVGHVGIDAGESALARQVVVNAFSGGALGVAMAQFVSNSGITVDLMPGDAYRFSDSGVDSRVVLAAASDFPVNVPRANQKAFTGSTILLGNLFDDNMTASLGEAIQTDEYQAAAETVDLGVAAVHDGGLDVDTSLAEDGVWFNFLNVGGGGARVAGLPANDTYRSNLQIPIRTTGEDLQHDLADGPMPKAEEGIGISANELLTFDLLELRKAGKIEGRAMRFVADRAGLNDREAPLLDSRPNAHANLVVIISSEDQVLSAYLNGEAVGVAKHGNVYSIDVDEERATRGLRYDGKFAEFNVPIPADARFLTLVATQLEKEHHDHTVFSGARLELGPPQNKKAAKKSSSPRCCDTG